MKEMKEKKEWEIERFKRKYESFKTRGRCGLQERVFGDRHFPIQYPRKDSVEEYFEEIEEKDIISLEEAKQKIAHFFRAKDAIMFVGKSFYSPSDFIEEAREVGVSKRVCDVPRDLKPGESVIYFAHINALDEEDSFEIEIEKDDEKIKKEVTTGIFAKGVYRGTQIITDKSIDELGVEPVSVEKVSAEPERHCGDRINGAMYVVTLSHEDYLKAIEEDEDAEKIVDSVIEEIDPVPFKNKYFRSIKYAERGEIKELIEEEGEVEL